MDEQELGAKDALLMPPSIGVLNLDLRVLAEFSFKIDVGYIVPVRANRVAVLGRAAAAVVSDDAGKGNLVKVI